MGNALDFSLATNPQAPPRFASPSGLTERDRPYRPFYQLYNVLHFQPDSQQVEQERPVDSRELDYVIALNEEESDAAGWKASETRPHTLTIKLEGGVPISERRKWTITQEQCQQRVNDVLWVVMHEQN